MQSEGAFYALFCWSRDGDYEGSMQFFS